MLCGHVLHAISLLAAVNAFHGFAHAHAHSNLSSTLCRRDSRDSTSSSRLSYVTRDVPSSSSCNSSSLASLAAAALARWTTGEFVDASRDFILLSGVVMVWRRVKVFAKCKIFLWHAHLHLTIFDEGEEKHMYA